MTETNETAGWRRRHPTSLEGPLQSRFFRIGAAALVGTVLVALTATTRGHSETESSSDAEIVVTPLFSEIPADLAGKRMTVIEASYPPMSTMPVHRHPGSVFVYVIAGTVRSQLGTDAEPVVYVAGQSWFEPPGARHLLMDNPDENEPARILAVLFGDDGAELVIPDDVGAQSNDDSE